MTIPKAALIALVLTAAAPAPPAQTPAPAPSEIVAAAPASDWVTIDPKDLLVMDLAPDAKARPRRVVIQLMPPPFSAGWIGNIRKLAAAHWYDGTSINRVQDNYVVQWGDATEKKVLPEGLAVVPESEYASSLQINPNSANLIAFKRRMVKQMRALRAAHPEVLANLPPEVNPSMIDPYALMTFLDGGWPVAGDMSAIWPVHCYGMVGVGRNLSPDTGSGAELYTVIGHAPRHLDRNVALVGRVIEGIENLSSLPRGTEALGFYKTAEERVPILSVQIASDIPTDKAFPRYEYMNTESATFAKYADARANRRDPFFIKPAGGADICNIPVPVRRKQG
jgi:cyclophilin family peptidyl-prolyl cis-trans isomerase